MIVAGEVIDHILPRVLLVADGHPDPDGDWNLQTLCRECDRSKSLRLDGGLGNRLVPLAERPTDQLAAAERARAGAELPAGAPA